VLSCTELRLDDRATHRNGYRERVLTTQVGDLTLAIPKLRQAASSPGLTEMTFSQPWALSTRRRIRTSGIVLR